MKTNRIIALALLGLSTLNSQLSTAFAQGTAFTYQGRLNENGVPVNHTYDLLFRPFNVPTGGTQLAFPSLRTVAISNGLFTTTLDFGPAIFNGDPLWLQIEISTNGFSGIITNLTPRQPLTPAPYAVFAAGLANGAVDTPQLAAGAVTASKIASNAVTNAKIADGAVDTPQLAGGAVTSAKVADGTLLPADLNLGNFDRAFWKVGGNTGTSADFIGTRDDQPFDVRVNNVRVMRYRFDTSGFATNAPNVIGGSSANGITTDVVGATIAGGGGEDGEGVSGFSLPNQVTAHFGTVGGGSGNKVSGIGGTVPGGSANTAAGITSFAAGYGAFANHDYSFVWSDGSEATRSATDGSVTMRATGGYRFFTASGSVGARLAAGDTSWSSICDRDAKKNFSRVDAEAVLDKLAAMPVQSWNYKWEADTNTPHLGPMAQDFKAAFYPGRDDKSISTLEFDGVELAAIQGLNQRVQELKNELKHRDAENAELKSRLTALEKYIINLSSKGN